MSSGYEKSPDYGGPEPWFGGVAIGVVLLLGSSFQASAESYDFLFTPSAAVFLDNRSTVAPGDRLNRPAIASLFPNHTIEEGVEEASTVWYVFLQRDADGYAADGITIYMVWDDPETVHFVAGYRGVIDAAGATIGTPLSELYPSGFAKCDSGLWYTCESPVSANISYVVDGTTCGDQVEWPSYFENSELTALDPCMTIDAIHLDAASTR